MLPDYEQRRSILDRDPLCCSDGFRVLCMLAMRHLMGIRVCPRCPHCNDVGYDGVPCQDIEGSSATSGGGVFGRVDAVFGAIENQEAGALHMYAQLFLQCLHQHTPLAEIVSLL